MKFFEFLDVSFQNASFDNSKQFCIKRDGYLQSIHVWVSWERKFYKFLGLFKVLGLFLGVKVGLIAEPVNRVPPPKVNRPEKPDLHIAQQTPPPVN